MRQKVTDLAEEIEISVNDLVPGLYFLEENSGAIVQRKLFAVTR
jgi:hypothetical protein